VADRTVTAVVVNYRSGDQLDNCLEALLASGDLLEKVIVVDNSPEDPSADVARRLSQEGRPVEVIDAPSNLGLAGGVNLALARVHTTFLAALNQDVTVRPGWLNALVSAMQGHPGAAVTCPLILMTGTDRVNSLGMTVHVSALGFNRLLGRAVSEVPSRTHEVGGLHGAAFVIRTDVLRMLGGWDATGFLYHEDVALSWDVLLAGRRIVAVPDAVVEHSYQLTMYPDKLYLLERNRWALLLSHLEIGRLVALAPILIAVELAIWLMALLRGFRFVGAKARSYRWLVRNRAAIGSWRERVRARATYDAQLLRERCTWIVPLDQVLAVGRERRPSTRIPEGGLPV
jgi:GT2 family glycosyltransferase